MKYIIDSFAWIEYFMGTKAGEKARDIIDGKEEKATPSICLAEIYAKTLKIEGTKMAEARRSFIKAKAAIIVLDEILAVEAARVDIDMKRKVRGWSLADSIVYATANIRKAQVVTGDEHFRDLPNVMFLG